MEQRGCSQIRQQSSKDYLIMIRTDKKLSRENPSCLISKIEVINMYRLPRTSIVNLQKTLAQLNIKRHHKN
jgi:hypothetical protein